MEGLEASIVSVNLLQDDYRFDSQFFQKEYLNEDQALDNHPLQTVGEFSFVTDGYHEVDDTSPIAMLTAKCASNWFADRVGADTIAKWVDDANRRSSLEIDDLILSTRGTVGNCAVVTKEALPANLDQDVARIALTTSSPLQPFFLLTYLNSRFGQDHIFRHSSGMVQQGLTLAKVRKIPIPILSDLFQSRITDTVFEVLRLKCAAKRNNLTASNSLLEALGLADWQPPEPLSYVASSKNAFASGRLDAQYFRPMYDEVEERLEDTGQSKPLSSILSINQRGRQPHYSDDGLPVVNSKHVRTNRVLLTGNRAATENGSPITINKGDVLLNGTGVGTIGRDAPTDLQETVRDTVLLAFEEEHRSRALLEQAKRAVEIAIEETEEVALSFLDNLAGKEDA